MQTVAARTGVVASATVSAARPGPAGAAGAAPPQRVCGWRGSRRALALRRQTPIAPCHLPQRRVTSMRRTVKVRDAWRGRGGRERPVENQPPPAAARLP